MAGVDNRFRRKGILSELMRYQTKWAKEKIEENRINLEIKL